MKNAPVPAVEAMTAAPTAAAVALCVLVATCLGLGQIRGSSTTFDEPLHLGAGYTDWVDGSYRIHLTGHPPLAEMWGAVPLLAMSPDRFPESEEWREAQPANFGELFLNRNRIPAATMLDAARTWNLVTLTLLVAAALVLWARRLGGAPAAWAGAAALALCIPWFSNAALVTADGLSAALFFATCAILSAPRRTAAVWALAGTAMGAAIASKYNMLSLPFLAGAALCAESYGDRARRPTARFLALAGGAAFAVVAAAYRFDRLPVFWREFSYLLRLLAEGRSGYFMGGHSATGGWWSYFPAAILVKTPLPLLLLGALGAREAARRPRAQAAWLLLPPVGYLLAAMTSRTQIGYRHVLPVFPFLCLWAALGAAWLWERGRGGRLLLAAAGLGLAASAATAYPHSLSYFNALARGHGEEWLSDSNMDWGQDLPALAKELSARGNPTVVLSYFGTGEPKAYGIKYVPLAFVTVVDRPGDATLSPGGPVLLAVSETNLVGTYYRNPALFAWLRPRRPVAVPGGSIFLYDLTADAPGRAILARMLFLTGRPGDARALLLQSGP